ncbi:Arm DNA-binding domain-containing protein [Selenomonas sp. AE3005]|uniref:Arm DNA-binding domain-containing protein n=1 Tax=Selenomonas sp. AE3005 TaxID=1485543 RepID=UPI0025D6DEEA|nr:Arm DNA-binding domain-containing protein [Selenomonas sp. AE3005]
MSVYKKITASGRVSWYAIFYYRDWNGQRKQKKKEGFATQREAKAYERDFIECRSGTPKMTFAVKYYGLPNNPARLAGAMGKDKPPAMDFWTLAEFKQFQHAVAGHEPYYTIYFKKLQAAKGRCGHSTAAHLYPSKQEEIATKLEVLAAG